MTLQSTWDGHFLIGIRDKRVPVRRRRVKINPKPNFGKVNSFASKLHLHPQNQDQNQGRNHQGRLSLQFQVFVDCVTSQFWDYFKNRLRNQCTANIEREILKQISDNFRLHISLQPNPLLSKVNKVQCDKPSIL